LTRAFIPLADLLRRAGRNDEALAVLDEGLRRHPQAVGGLVTLARTLASAGRPTQAAEAAERVVDCDPDNLVALELIADEDRRRGDLVAASGHYERLMQLDPDNLHWGTVLTELREQRTAAAAEAAGGDGADGFATLTLVDLYLAQGYRQKAESLLRRLADERPDDLQVGRRLASLPGAEMEDEGSATLGSISGTAALPKTGSAGKDAAGDRRELARVQFASWIERLRIEREMSP
jgi:tetratricopeptide (TPR) repeat protein